MIRDLYIAFDMKLYELTCLLSSKLTEEEVKNFSEKIISFVQEKGGTLKEFPSLTNKIIKRKLVPQIKRESQGYVNVLNFYLEPQKIEDLKARLDSENQILRYIILAKKPLKKEIRTKTPPASPHIPKIEKKVKPSKEKVDLKEIEEKLEEILNEN